MDDVTQDSGVEGGARGRTCRRILSARGGWLGVGWTPCVMAPMRVGGSDARRWLCAVVDGACVERRATRGAPGGLVRWKKVLVPGSIEAGWDTRSEPSSMWREEVPPS